MVLKPEPRTHPLLKELDIRDAFASTAAERALEILQDSSALDTDILPSPLVDSPSETKQLAKLDSPSKKKGIDLQRTFNILKKYIFFYSSRIFNQFSKEKHICNFSFRKRASRGSTRTCRGYPISSPLPFPLSFS